MKDFEKRLLQEINKVEANNKHGYGYVPFLLSQKFGKFTDATKEIQKDFPLFECILNANKDLGIVVIYGGEEINVSLSVND